MEKDDYYDDTEQPEEEEEEEEEEESYLWEGDENDSANEEFYANEDEEGDDNHVISAVVGRKTDKGVEYFKVEWDNGAETSWETKEVIAEYGAHNLLKKFQAERAASSQNKQAVQAETDRSTQRRLEQAKKLAEQRAMRKEAIMAQLTREPPPPTYELPKSPQQIVEAPAKPKEERSRVRSLRLLATKAFAAAVLLYEELSDFPTSLKAPVFSILLKESQLTASHLKVLLSTDQKRLDLSPAPSIISDAHVEAVAERCHQLEHLDLKGCSGISRLSQLATKCQQITYLDVSGLPLKRLDDITKGCGLLRVLKAARCGLTVLLSAHGRHQKYLEELDVSGNPQLDAMDALSRLVPGRCPNLRILRANKIFTSCDYDSSEKLFAELSADYVTATYGKTNVVPHCALQELHVRQHSNRYVWLNNAKLLEAIMRCLASPDCLKVLDISVPPKKQPYWHSLIDFTTEYFNKAHVITPGLERLKLRYFVISPRVKFEPNLPASLKHLDIRNHGFTQEMLESLILLPNERQVASTKINNVPRLASMDLGATPETCVRVEPTLLLQFFRNGHHVWESLKLPAFGDDASHPTLITELTGTVMMQSQPFLKKLDISLIRWLTPTLLCQIVHKDLLPNLERLSISVFGSLSSEHIDRWLMSGNVPPKLYKLKLVDHGTNMFHTQDLKYREITHLTSNSAIPTTVGLINSVKTFPNLQRFKIVKVTNPVDAFLVELGDGDHHLPHLELCCCSFDSYRNALEAVKNSNVRTLFLCEHMYGKINQAIASDKHVREMLVARGDLPATAVAECDVFQGDHRVKCCVKSCTLRPNPYFKPLNYWI